MRIDDKVLPWTVGLAADGQLTHREVDSCSCQGEPELLVAAELGHVVALCVTFHIEMTEDHGATCTVPVEALLLVGLYEGLQMCERLELLPRHCLDHHKQESTEIKTNQRTVLSYVQHLLWQVDASYLCQRLDSARLLRRFAGTGSLFSGRGRINVAHIDQNYFKF